MPLASLLEYIPGHTFSSWLEMETPMASHHMVASTYAPKVSVFLFKRGGTLWLRNVSISSS